MSDKVEPAIHVWATEYGYRVGYGCTSSTWFLIENDCRSEEILLLPNLLTEWRISLAVGRIKRKLRRLEARKARYGGR